MKKYESQRGAILVESALVVGAIFLMLFGTVFLSIIGFDQMSADGASYEVAHQTSVGASSPPNAAAQTFPNIAQSNITSAVQPAPTASIPVDYGYNAAQYSNEADNSVNNRHGGVAMMQGTEVLGSASKKSASILGMPISVMGSMVEPMWLENGVHFDAENSNGYGQTSNTCAPPTPAPQGATPGPQKCFQGSVFTTGENAPPYFVGFDYMAHCTGQLLPWGLNAAFGFPNQPTTCDANGDTNTQFTPLGVAEFLDFSNWCDASAPAAKCTTAPLNPGLSGSKPSDSTFATIACHQRAYAAVATFFASHTNLEAIYYGNGGFTGASPTGDYQTYGGPAYYYLNRQHGDNGTSQSNSFANFEGLDTPALSQDTSLTGIVNIGPTDKAVQQIYGFDGQDVHGPPSGANPLNPGNGC